MITAGYKEDSSTGTPTQGRKTKAGSKRTAGKEDNSRAGRRQQDRKTSTGQEDN